MNNMNNMNNMCNPTSTVVSPQSSVAGLIVAVTATGANDSEILFPIPASDIQISQPASVQ